MILFEGMNALPGFREGRLFCMHGSSCLQCWCILLLYGDVCTVSECFSLRRFSLSVFIPLALLVERLWRVENRRVATA